MYPTRGVHLVEGGDHTIPHGTHVAHKRSGWQAHMHANRAPRADAVYTPKSTALQTCIRQGVKLDDGNRFRSTVCSCCWAALACRNIVRSAVSTSLVAQLRVPELCGMNHRSLASEPFAQTQSSSAALLAFPLPIVQTPVDIIDIQVAYCAVNY